MKNNCFECKFNIQGENGRHCSHPKKVTYKKLWRKCKCGRHGKLEKWLQYWNKWHEEYKKDNNQPFKPKACGRCTGRGNYIYPGAYDECDVIIRNIFGFKRYGFKKIA